MEQLNNSLLREIGALYRSVNTACDQVYRALHLQKGQFVFLTRVCEHPGIRQTDLAALLQVDKTTVAKAVPKLLEVGYLLRERDETDERAWRLSPTPQGLTLYDELIREENRSIACCLSGLSEEEVREVGRLLAKMRKNSERLLKNEPLSQPSIRLATEGDLPSILQILKHTREEMASYGNNQWGEDYPQAEDFLVDIREGTLSVLEVEGKIRAFVCLNETEPEEYGAVPWSSPAPALVLHRMAVDPNARRMGLGGAIMRFADETAEKMGLTQIKSETYSINEKMKHLLESHGYRQAGSIHFKGRPLLFPCYEKLLEAPAPEAAEPAPRGTFQKAAVSNHQNALRRH